MTRGRKTCWKAIQVRGPSGARGELYLVAVEPDHLTLHLAGTCSGCPGAVLTTRGVIEPAVHAVAPSARVVVTNGVKVPEGASLVG